MTMLYSLLSEETESNSSWATYVLLAVLVVAIVVMLVVSSRRNKKRQQEAENLIKAVKPGNKVKTIGGVCGIVVEVDEEENTFVLETGSEVSGKCYMKFDRQAIYQTDAVAESTTDKDKKHHKGEEGEEAPAEEGESVQAEEAPAEQPAPADEPASEPAYDDEPAEDK